LRAQLREQLPNTRLLVLVFPDRPVSSYIVGTGLRPINVLAADADHFAIPAPARAAQR